MTVELTQQEAAVLDDYLFRKLVRLKESGLEDAKCFIVLQSVHKKLKEANHD